MVHPVRYRCSSHSEPHAMSDVRFNVVRASRRQTTPGNARPVFPSTSIGSTSFQVSDRDGAGVKCDHRTHPSLTRDWICRMQPVRYPSV